MTSITIPECIHVKALLTLSLFSAWELPDAHRWDVIRVRNGVAPVGLGQPFVRVYYAESRGEAANHAARSVRLTRHFFDTHDEDVILWGCLGELQHDLVRPVAHVVGQDLVTLGALPISLDGDTLVKLLPEFERDLRDIYVANHVPRHERVVQLLGRVERGKELGLGDAVSEQHDPADI